MAFEYAGASNGASILFVILCWKEGELVFLFCALQYRSRRYSSTATAFLYPDVTIHYGIDWSPESKPVHEVSLK